MSKSFRILEFLGKRNEKKWSQILIFLLIKGVKSPHKKELFLREFCRTEQDFLVLVFLTPFNGLLAPTSQNLMFKLFKFSESLGESNERSGLRLENFCS